MLAGSISAVYVAWQDPKTRSWYPVGRLSSNGGVYRFVYTRGALLAPGFVPFGRMTDIYSQYESEELFPLFANRLLAKNRPEYPRFVNWLGGSQGSLSPLDALARSGGKRGTDSLQIFPAPERTADGKFVACFFAHGLSHLPKYAEDAVEGLSPGERLWLMKDFQNPFDSIALAIRTEQRPTLVGWAPRYLNEDLCYVCDHGDMARSANLAVEQVNHDAPVQFRLLCRFTCDWPEGFAPMSGVAYQTLDGHPSPVALDSPGRAPKAAPIATVPGYVRA